MLVVNVMGRVFMDALDDPFAAVERDSHACPLGAGCDAIVIDFHAEATSEKQAMGHFVDGRASLVVGTHTHVPTADQQILPGGTAYMTDAGMCGDYDSVLGMDKEEPLRRFLQKTPGARMEPALGAARSAASPSMSTTAPASPRGLARPARAELAEATPAVLGLTGTPKCRPAARPRNPKCRSCGTSPEPCSGSGRVSGVQRMNAARSGATLGFWFGQGDRIKMKDACR